MREKPLQRAIAAAGGVNALARAIGVTSASLCGWKRIPSNRIAAVAEATGIPARELRPDLAATFTAGTPDRAA